MYLILKRMYLIYNIITVQNKSLAIVRKKILFTTNVSHSEKNVSYLQHHYCSKRIISYCSKKNLIYNECISFCKEFILSTTSLLLKKDHQLLFEKKKSYLQRMYFILQRIYLIYNIITVQKESLATAQKKEILFTTNVSHSEKNVSYLQHHYCSKRNLIYNECISF